MSIEEILRELREDRVHGASWYFLRSIDVIKLAIESNFNTNSIKALLNELRNIRPGMASIINLTNIIEDAINMGLNLNDVINRLKSWYEDATKRLIAQLDRYQLGVGQGR